MRLLWLCVVALLHFNIHANGVVNATTAPRRESRRNFTVAPCPGNVKRPFRCSLEGPCIEIDLRCNNHTDCPHGEDEVDCTHYQTCPTGFVCSLGVGCIKWSNVCDGAQQCADGSDETDETCVLKAVREDNYPCNKDSFYCEKENICIEGKLRCDGTNDCEDRADEQGCTSGGATSTKTHACERQSLGNQNVTLVPCPGISKGCIPQSRICDKVFDCEDFSDEENCPFPPPGTQKCKPETELMCDSEGTSCVSLQQVCNGQRDCPDGSDERHANESVTHCAPNPCLHANGGCQHICANFFGEARCLCQPGFRVSHDLKHCEDVNECDQWGTCTQRCKNFPGTYKCSCKKGYWLDSKAMTCQPTVQEPLYLLYNTRRDLRRYSINSRSIFRILNFRKPTQIQHIDYALDVNNRLTVYFVEHPPSDGERIVTYRETSDLKSTVLTLSSDEHVQAISMDWINNRLYFVTEEGIFVMDPSVPNRRVLLFRGHGYGSCLLAVPMHNSIYFVNMYSDHLIRADLDGLGVNEVTHVANGGYIRDLSWDHALNRLVWLDTITKHVHSVPFNSSDIEQGKPQAMDLSQIVWANPISLAVFNEQYFWVDQSEQAIYSIFKFLIDVQKKHSQESVVISRESGQAHAGHVKVVHPYLKPRGPSLCSMSHACDGLCLPTAGGAFISCFNCFYSRSEEQNQRNCITKLKVSSTPMTLRDKNVPFLVQTRFPLIALIFLLCLLLVGAILFVCFFWRRRHHETIGVVPPSFESAAFRSKANRGGAGLGSVRFSKGQGGTEDLHYDNPVYDDPSHITQQAPHHRHDQDGSRVYQELLEEKQGCFAQQDEMVEGPSYSQDALYPQVTYMDAFTKRDETKQPLLK